MKNGFVKILVNIIILLAILVVMDIVVGSVGEMSMRILNKAPHDGDAALTNYDLNAASPDVAILGSSTAICHYDPNIIHDSLISFTGNEYDVFNMGMSAQRLAYEYCALSSLVDRKVPKIVILDVWASYLSEGFQDISYSVFRPYINYNSHVREMMDRHGELDLLTKSSMYCWNTEIVKLIMSYRKSTETNGFNGKSKVELTHPAINIFEEDTCGLAKVSVNEFDGIITLAKKKDIKLFVVLSPRLSPSDTTCLSYKYMRNKCAENEIPFLDYSNNEKYFIEHYFRDNTHMNYYGAERFTRDFMKDIKGYIFSNDNG